MLCINADGVINGFEFNIAHRNRDEIARDGLRHREIPIPILVLTILRGAHERQQSVWNAQARIIGQANSGRILNRQHGARVNRLGLREEIRLFLPSRLRRGQPLQAFRAWARLIDNPQPRGLGPNIDGHSRAQDRVGLGQCIIRGHPAVLCLEGDGFNEDIFCI